MSRTDAILKLLRDYESRNVVAVDPTGDWPIVWERAKGMEVWDVEGRKYLDMTAAFGVAAAGHANPRVVRAGQRQMSRLLHAMGDVHPHPGKADLARELSRLTFGRWGCGRGKTIFCNSGFEAVEAALKTSMLATGKPGVIAFEGGYHGLGYGALNATHRELFRAPFQSQLGAFGYFVPFPQSVSQMREARRAIERWAQRRAVGAVLVEPVQARGGMRVPPVEFLPMLRRLCDQHGWLLVADEIYTGFGRGGAWFACEHSRVTPDLICLGKSLTGGFPLSACVGRAEVMDEAWPVSEGEAIHTSTFLGHPVGCAMALAQIREIKNRRLVERSRRWGPRLREMLEAVKVSAGHRTAVRGVGLMMGWELRGADGRPAGPEVFAIVKAMLRLGCLVLPEGEFGNVVGFTPPLTVNETQLRRAARTLQKAVTGVLGV